MEKKNQSIEYDDNANTIKNAVVQKLGKAIKCSRKNKRNKVVYAMKNRNVFSDNSNAITMLIYTQTFLTEDNAIQYFTNANLLKNIKIYYMPLLVKPEKPLSIETISYIHRPEGNAICNAIEYPGFSRLIGYTSNIPCRKSEDELNKMTEDFLLHNRIDPQIFDYVVASDGWCNVHPEYDCILPYSKAKEILRLYMVNSKQYELTDHYSCDESLYYIYRNRVLFPEYQTFWSSTLKCKNEPNTDIANALGNRLLLLSMCIDNANIEAYKVQNNTSAMHLKYHISYLLLLITGTFDSIAWIINNLYGLGFEVKKRQQIDLLNKDFRKAIVGKSTFLFSILSGSGFICKVEAIRELRDRIVHRNFIDTISSGNRNKRKNYLLIDQTASDKLIKAGISDTAYFIRSEDINAIDIVSFLQYLQMNTVNIVNCLLKCISNEIYHTTNSSAAWKIFAFPEEPYVL